MLRNLFLTFFVIAVTLEAAQAGSVPDDVDPRDAAWADSQQYQNCGQSCMFQKGNEALTLDATYTLEKLELVKGLHSDEVHERLAGFCSEDETGSECQDRYVVAASRALYETRLAIGTNETSAGALHSVKGTSAHPGTRKADLRPQIPAVINWDRIKDRISRTKQKVRSREEWARDMAPQPPNEADFITFKQIPKDPSDASLGTYTVPDMSPEGLQKQKKAYQEALAAYNDRVKDLAWNPKTAKEARKAPNTIPDKDSLEYQAFQGGRRRVIGAVNEKLVQMGMVGKREKSKPRADRAPAKSGKPAETPPPKASNLQVKVPSATQEKTAPPEDPRLNPENDTVRPVEASSERDDLVTVTWSPEQLHEQATQELRKTPPSPTPRD